MPYTIGARALTPSGTAVATLTDATVTEVEMSLDGWGGCTLVLPALSSQVAHLISADTATWNNVAITADDGSGAVDLQYYVPTNVEADIDKIVVRCAGKGWYLGRRYVGRASRVNQLANGGFEAGTLSDWTPVGVTASASTDMARVGTYSAKLEQATAATDTYLRQRFTSGPNGVGVEWTAVAHVFIESGDWLGPAFARRGLYMQLGTSIATVFRSDQITRETPRGTWVRLETTINVPPDTTETVEVRLYAPGGTVYWDEVSVTQQESLSYINSTRLAAVAGLVAHAQDTALGKSDLDLVHAGAGVDFPLGAALTRTWKYQDHARIADALDEIASLESGGRWWLDVAQVTLVGVDTSSPFTFLSWPDQITSYRWSLDASQAASSVVVLASDSDGPDREEAGATDVVAFGGAVLEHVMQAPPGTDIRGLQQVADAELAARSRPAVLTVVCAGCTANSAPQDAETALVDGWLTPGAVVDVSGLVVGTMDMTGVYRVSNVRLDPQARTLTVDLRFQT